MSEHARPADHVEVANAAFWAPPSLEQLLREVEPVKSFDQFAIDDLTDNEWEAFCSAVSE